MGGPLGRDRLLDAAERLFAEQGIEATSSRAINAAADLSPAALHYHFGNKDRIVEAVLRRRMDVLIDRRVKILERAIAHNEPMDEYFLAELIILPLAEFGLSAGTGKLCYVRFLSRMYTERSAAMVAFLETNFADSVAMFDARVAAAAPHLTGAEVHQRRILAGEFATHGLARIAELVEEGVVDPPDANRRILSLISFVAGGLVARNTQTEVTVVQPASPPRH